METVNLEKICELLEKGVDNPSIQNEVGKFSLKNWQEEVQKYTEPFLNVIAGKLDEVLAQEKDVRWGKGFKIASKSQGKKTRIMSLQHATCKLPEPFAITIDEGRRTQIGALVLLGPSESIIEEKYGNCMIWGLSWFGTTKNAEIARRLLLSVNQGLGFTVSMAKYKFLGGSIARLFNSISTRELMEVGLDHIVDIITTDFVKLSSSLYKNRHLFQTLPPGETEKRQEELPTKADIEKAICFIRSKTDRKEIGKAEIFEIVEAEFERKGIRLKLDWQGTTEGKLRDWFG